MAGWDSFNMANEIINFYYRGVAITAPGTLYMRLLVDPSDRSGSAGTETNYGGYARLAVPRSTGGLFSNAPSSGQLTNSGIIVFPSALSLGNGNLVWFDFVDTISGSFTKLYNGGPINPERAVVVGKDVRFRAGALIITF
jgi:hypothetical protein